MAFCLDLDRFVGDAPFYYLRTDWEKDPPPDSKFLIYTRRRVPRITPGELPAIPVGPRPVYVIGRDVPEQVEPLRAAGFEPFCPYADNSKPRVLYRRPGTKSEE